MCIWNIDIVAVNSVTLKGEDRGSQPQLNSNSLNLIFSYILLFTVCFCTVEWNTLPIQICYVDKLSSKTI